MQVRGRVSRVSAGSIARKIGIGPGDEIVSINNRPLLDVIDYLYHSSRARLRIKWLRGGLEMSAQVEKNSGESLGLDFEEELFDGVRSCANRCLFCFIDQMPPGLRKSLYLKDEDYRLSFLHGNFITLTALGDDDMERIRRLRLSPLYVSVHATNPAVRRRMLGHRGAGDIMERLSFLSSSGIQVHTQIVLCPGINDGAELDRSISDLAGLFPSVASIGIVPVGLTRWRDRLSELSPVSPSLSAGIIEKVHHSQRKYLAEKGTRLVFAADELYLSAGKALPGSRSYEDFPQLENGIGLARRFTDSFRRLSGRLPDKVSVPLTATVATSVLAEPVIEPFIARLNLVRGLSVRLLVIRNGLFGDSVTVAGLLPGESIISSVEREIRSDLLIIPGAALRDGRYFLDDLTVEDLSNRIGIRVAAAKTPGEMAGLLI